MLFPVPSPKDKSQELLSARVVRRAEDSLRTSKVCQLVGRVGWGLGGMFKDDKVTFSRHFKRKEGGRFFFELIWIVE